MSRNGPLLSEATLADNEAVAHKGREERLNVFRTFAMKEIRNSQRVTPKTGGDELTVSETSKQVNKLEPGRPYFCCRATADTHNDDHLHTHVDLQLAYLILPPSSCTGGIRGPSESRTRGGPSVSFDAFYLRELPKGPWLLACPACFLGISLPTTGRDSDFRRRRVPSKRVGQ